MEIIPLLTSPSFQFLPEELYLIEKVCWCYPIYPSYLALKAGRSISMGFQGYPPYPSHSCRIFLSLLAVFQQWKPEPSLLSQAHSAPQSNRTQIGQWSAQSRSYLPHRVWCDKFSAYLSLWKGLGLPLLCHHPQHFHHLFRRQVFSLLAVRKLQFGQFR